MMCNLIQALMTSCPDLESVSNHLLKKSSAEKKLACSECRPTACREMYDATFHIALPWAMNAVSPVAGQALYV